MAAKEMYDYLTDTVADVDVTLNIKSQGVLFEDGSKDVEVHRGRGRSRETVVLSSDSIFYVRQQWQALTASDKGTIIDMYHDTAKGSGGGASFYWVHPTDGHTYVVQFEGPMSSFVHGYNIYGVAEIRLFVLGRKAE